MVGSPVVALGWVVGDWVHHLTAGTGGGFKAIANRDPLHGVDAHHRGGQLAIQLGVPGNVRAKPSRHVFDDHPDQAPQGIASPTGIIDQGVDGSNLAGVGDP